MTSFLPHDKLTEIYTYWIEREALRLEAMIYLILPYSQSFAAPLLSILPPRLLSDLTPGTKSPYQETLDQIFLSEMSYALLPAMPSSTISLATLGTGLADNAIQLEPGLTNISSNGTAQTLESLLVMGATLVPRLHWTSVISPFIWVWQLLSHPKLKVG